VSNNLPEEKKLDILHDHYKETFARIKEVEANRDKLFLWLIAILAALILQISYPVAVGKTIGKLSIFGAELDIDHLPLPALLNVTWLLGLVIGLRYCQGVTFVSRQYPYLHSLEDVISPMLGGGNMYRREGEVYLKDFPAFLNFAWIFYDFFFPLTIMLASAWLAVIEYRHIKEINIFDIATAAALFLVFFVYRIVPALISLWNRIF